MELNFFSFSLRCCLHKEQWRRSQVRYDGAIYRISINLAYALSLIWRDRIDLANDTMRTDLDANGIKFNLIKISNEWKKNQRRLNGARPANIKLCSTVNIKLATLWRANDKQ